MGSASEGQRGLEIGSLQSAALPDFLGRGDRSAACPSSRAHGRSVRRAPDAGVDTLRAAQDRDGGRRYQREIRRRCDRVCEGNDRLGRQVPLPALRPRYPTRRRYGVGGR